jgi:hypothetical protein
MKLTENNLLIAVLKRLDETLFDDGGETGVAHHAILTGRDVRAELPLRPWLGARSSLRTLRFAQMFDVAEHGERAAGLRVFAEKTTGDDFVLRGQPLDFEVRVAVENRIADEDFQPGEASTDSMKWRRVYLVASAAQKSRTGPLKWSK